MAEGLNATSGIGQGQAQVYGRSGSLDYYMKTLQQQQAKRAAEQKELQDQLSKVKIDGLRDPDKPIFYEKYNNWKSIPALISQEKNPLKKMELQAEFDKQFMELNDYAAKSREAEKDDDDFSGKALDDRFRTQFTDDAIAKVQRNRTLPINHPDYVRDKSVLARQIDTSKILDELNKVDDQLLQSAKYDNPQTRRITSGNKTGTESIYTRKVDPKVQALNYGMKYDTDRTFKAFIQKEYADVFDQMGEDEAKATAIRDLISKRPLVKQDSPKMDWDRAPDNFYAHYDYRMANGDGNTNSPTPIKINIPFGKEGKDVVGFDDYIGFTSPAANFAGSKFIDLKTGKEGGTLSSSNDYQIVGVGNAPFITGGKTLKGSLAQPNFAKNNSKYIQKRPIVHVQYKDEDGEVVNRFVDYNTLPSNIKNSKAFKTATANFQPSSDKTTSQPKGESGMVTVTVDGKTGQIPKSKLADFRKKYPTAKVN